MTSSIAWGTPATISARAFAGDDGVLRGRLRSDLEVIAERTGETVYLAVPSGDETYYLDAFVSAQSPKTTCPIGIREHLGGSAIGLVSLRSCQG